MRRSFAERVGEWRHLLALAARTVAGRRFWIAPLLTLVWPVIVVAQAALGDRQAFDGADAQNQILAVPMALLAIGLGGRVIAGEIDRRTLEIAYTVPGGAHRVWIAKMIAVGLILLGAELLLSICALALCGPFPPGALYGAAQAAAVYGIVAMAFSTLTRSEATGAMLTVGILALNGLFTGFGSNPTAFSPFFNPAAMTGATDAEVLARTVQNRIGMALLGAAIVALTFARAERREKLLG